MTQFARYTTFYSYNLDCDRYGTYFNARIQTKLPPKNERKSEKSIPNIWI